MREGGCDGGEGVGTGGGGGTAARLGALERCCDAEKGQDMLGQRNQKNNALGAEEGV